VQKLIKLFIKMGTKKIIAIILIFANIGLSQAQYTAIADACFEQHLINLGIDSDGVINGQVLTTDISNVISLDISGDYDRCYVNDLTGIEGFTSLEIIHVNNNILTSANFSNNPNLKEIYCSNGNINNINVTQNTLLEIIICERNNISDIDLDNLDLNIEIPREVRITASSRGKLDQDKNSIFYTIDRLDAGEKGSMTVDGIVENGTLGDALTSDATIAYDNPINRAQENAQDYDVDDFVVHTALGTASVFGLGNITLLGWLTILLGLFIVFLVARWLYLEREELRAQAYVNGYGRNNYVMAPAPVHNGYLAPVGQAQPVVHHYTQPVQTMPEQHVVHHTVAPQQAPVQNQAVQPAVQQSVQQNNERTDYRPYRPNRG